MEVAHALTRLTQGRVHEFVNNVPPEMVQALLGLVPTLTSFQIGRVESSSSSAVGSVAIESRGWRSQNPERTPGQKGRLILKCPAQVVFQSLAFFL